MKSEKEIRDRYENEIITKQKQSKLMLEDDDAKSLDTYAFLINRTRLRIDVLKWVLEEE